MKLVIVESPAKAKTINKYLGSEYKVVASFGHIRDLPSKEGAVLPEKGFDMVWHIEPKAEKHIKEIISLLKQADALYLASDPDREGEAIAWHVVQELTKRQKLKDIPVYRVTFHEITKQAVTEAMKAPRQIDMPLVDAYLARRALDYLVGFSLSPVLWRKLPGSRSAGRVQSVALRLICERENEIEAFHPKEFWTVDAVLKTPEKEKFEARLTHLNGQKLDKFTLNSKQLAESAAQQVLQQSLFVLSVEKKQEKRNPAPAFTTSTLQQEASRKLGFPAKKTMRVAQSLYEGVSIQGETVGLITYMRTDSTALSQEAIGQIRSYILEKYGKEYLPDSPRYYKNHAKNAQEAHEAIRPTLMSRSPAEIEAYLDKDEAKLYALIFKRALACQMASAVIDKVAVDIGDESDSVRLRATGQSIAFAGFIKVYQEGVDEKNDQDQEKMLPVLSEKETLEAVSVLPNQHFTEPPPRYSEASLVKKLEELGIGRPSTYASIISVLQERDYVSLVSKRFLPSERGRLVTVFLEQFFNIYVQYDFTAQLEDKLDEISSGKRAWKDVMEDFWKKFEIAVQKALELKGTEVTEKLQEVLSDTLFSTEEERLCPVCHEGKKELKIGRFGAFIGCSRYPECKYTRPLWPDEEKKTVEQEEGDSLVSDGEKTKSAFPTIGAVEKQLGEDDNGTPVFLKKGPYGWYVQSGDGTDKTKVKRSSLPKTLRLEDVSLEQALKLVSLPRVLGTVDGEEVFANIGRFGPYVGKGKTFASVRAPESVYDITLERATELLSKGKTKTQPVEIGVLGGEKITLNQGKFGPYVKCGKIIASLPKQMKEEGRSPSQEEAIALINAKKTPDKKKTESKSSKKVKEKTAEKTSKKTKKSAVKA
jgi:DNA topoisomerase I